MSETLQIEAAIGSAINPDFYEDCVQTLIRSAWSNSNEDTRLKSEAMRQEYFGDGPQESELVVLGRFEDEVVCASLGKMKDWSFAGWHGEYLELLGKKALEIRLFGVREPYRNLGFGSQLLGATAYVADKNECKFMSTVWADFQWDWFQARGGFEGKFGYIAESVRALPTNYPGFDPANLRIL